VAGTAAGGPVVAEERAEGEITEGEPVADVVEAGVGGAAAGGGVGA